MSSFHYVLPWRAPERPQVDEARAGILKLAGEAEGGRCRPALRHAPQVVAQRRERRACVAQRAAHVAEGVGGIFTLECEGLTSLESEIAHHHQ